MCNLEELESFIASDMAHTFGNIDTWTKDKLDRVESYLRAYLVALKNWNFRLEYIDAFAGTGYVTRDIEIPAESLFESEEVVHLRDFIDGSARVALRLDPPFSDYRFIEKHRKRSTELLALKEEFPELGDRIEIICGDANVEVQRLCQADWLAENRRAVMFLDPYGTQVTWQTIEAIASTQAIDLWILFPISTVNRLLNRDGRLIPARKRRLDLLFGEETWFEKIYNVSESPSLFPGEVMTTLRKTQDPFGVIERYFLERLESIFAEVATNTLVMKNSSNSPIFSLCFAAGNPKGARIAVRIANYILGKKK